MRSGLGVALVGLWRDDRYTYGQVERPIDSDASERLLFARGRLKMGVPTVEQERLDSTARWCLKEIPELEQSALTA